MSEDFSLTLYSIRKSLEKGELPTKKTAFWLVESLEQCFQDFKRTQNALNVCHRENDELKVQMKNLKLHVLAKIKVALEIYDDEEKAREPLP